MFLFKGRGLILGWAPTPPPLRLLHTTLCRTLPRVALPWQFKGVLRVWGWRVYVAGLRLRHAGREREGPPKTLFWGPSPKKIPQKKKFFGGKDPKKTHSWQNKWWWKEYTMCIMWWKDWIFLYKKYTFFFVYFWCVYFFKYKMYNCVIVFYTKYTHTRGCHTVWISLVWISIHTPDSYPCNRWLWSCHKAIRLSCAPSAHWWFPPPPPVYK